MKTGIEHFIYGCSPLELQEVVRWVAASDRRGESSVVCLCLHLAHKLPLKLQLRGLCDCLHL
jgi:hypothetical protein